MSKANNSTIKESRQLEVVPAGVGSWISVRFGLAYLAFFGFANVYALRVNLSVAILSMVNASYLVHPGANNESDLCPAGPIHVNHVGGEFNWDGHNRGLVLGAFFYGYIFTQLPGGYLASRFGGKVLLGGGVLCTSVLTILTPVTVRLSFPLFICLRILEGIGEGVTFPAMHAIWGAWAPRMERSKLISLTYAGCHFGTVITQPLSGILSASNIMGGWPSVFYIFGISGVLWCIAWFLLAKNYPHQCKKISSKELKYIEDNLELDEKSSSVPWKAIALSKEVWAISIAHTCNNWGFYTLLTSLPLYLKNVLRFDITQDATLAALPYLVMFFSINISGVFADFLRSRGFLTTTQTRKIFNTISFIGPAVCLLGAGFVGCDKAAAVSLICLATLFNGLSFSGYFSNHVDLSSRYAGVLMGITNTWATIPGILSPLVVGALTEKNHGRSQWIIVFGISAAIYVIGAVLYIILGSGVEQPWNQHGLRKSTEEDRQYLISEEGE